MPHQQTSPQQSSPHPPSSDTGTNRSQPSAIVETLEHRRFAEFCDACRRYRYIGLCYGPPGVGKTLSARNYSRWDKVKESDRWDSGPGQVPTLDTVFYTPSVVNAPGNVSSDIRRCRDTLRDLAIRPLRLEKEERLEVIRRRDEEYHAKLLYEIDWLAESLPECHPTYGEVAKEYSIKELQIRDPTTLILVDEADRLRMASLEQVRREIGDVIENKLEHTIQTASRSVLIPITARWNLYPVTESPEVIFQKIDDFAASPTVRL